MRRGSHSLDSGCQVGSVSSSRSGWPGCRPEKDFCAPVSKHTMFGKQNEVRASQH